MKIFSLLAVVFFMCNVHAQNVGIGTTTPTTKLEVAGQVKITGGTPGNGKVLTSDATGLATWGTAGILQSSQYVQLGFQPAGVQPGQPFTFSTAILTSPDIIANTGVFNPPFFLSGTIFTLVTTGRYEVNYHMTYTTDGGVVLYFGSTVPTMAPLSYSMIGKTASGAVSGSVLIEVTSVPSFLSVNAASGNALTVNPPANSSTTNQGATAVSIKKISN